MTRSWSTTKAELRIVDGSVVEKVGRESYRDVTIETFTREVAVLTALSAAPLRQARTATVRSFDPDRPAVRLSRLTGEPLAARKLPTTLLDPSLVLSVCDLCAELGRWPAEHVPGLLSFDLARQLREARQPQPADADVATLVDELNGGHAEFAHGDLFPRNLLCDPAATPRLALLDWEWAGWYPPMFDLATFGVGVALTPAWSGLVRHIAEGFTPRERALWAAGVYAVAGREAHGVHSPRAPAVTLAMRSLQEAILTVLVGSRPSASAAWTAVGSWRVPS